MRSQAITVEDYLAELPEECRETLQAVRRVILKNLLAGYEEGMQYGMIGYYVPHSIYPAGYHTDPKEPLPYVNLASHKGHCSLYMLGIYGSPDLRSWFQTEWKKTGKKLDMGKSCIRFRKAADLPLDLIGTVIKRVPVKDYIATYEAALSQSLKRKSQTKTKKLS